MMSNKLSFLFISVFMCALLHSCKPDFLELNSPTAVPAANALSTEADLQTALRGAYAGMRSANHFGRSIPVFGDLFADNAYISSQNSGRYTYGNTYTWTVANGDMANVWSVSYNVILRVNNIINAEVSGPNVDQIKGEAYAIRALNYFYLVRFFARPYTDNPQGLGVPIITKYDVSFYPTRSTVEEVYKLILEDLTKAYTMAPKFTNSSQLYKYSAQALKAKVYLTMGDKANAKTAALDVINNSGFTLVSAAGYKAYWDNAQIRTDKVETLFEVSSDAIANAGFDDLSNIYDQKGYGDILASDDLYALFSTTDVRRTLYSTGTRGGLPAVFVNKYPNLSGDRSDTKVLRLSEMYLIVAEASLPENEADARTYVNAITSRRNAAPITSTGAQLFEDIITERRKELAFEGDRFHDLNRLKRDIVRSTNYPAANRLITYDNFRRVFPIPLSETDANPNIRTQQNPGYL
jgi:hypothetical protein